MFSILFLLTAMVAADDPKIRLPKAPPPPMVQPAPVDPMAPVVLSGEAIYVIDSTPDATILVHPADAIKVSKESGPIKIRAKFVDSGGKVETRYFKGPHIWILEPARTQKGVGLFIVPLGYSSQSEIVRETIDVDAGQGPIPPPKPKPVDPKPDPIPSGELRVLFVREMNGKHTREQTNIFNSPKIAEYLNGKCPKDSKGRPEWRVYDPDQQFAASESSVMKAMFRESLEECKKQGLPAVAIAVGSDVRVYTLNAKPNQPALTEADVLNLLRKAGGK